MSREHSRLARAAVDAGAVSQATLDAVPANVALLDDTGRIVAVNGAWADFSSANGGSARTGVGVSYLEVCDTAGGEDQGTAADVAQAIRANLRGDRTVLEFEYPCHGPDIERWFTVRIAPFGGTETTRVVVLHQDVTARVVAERGRAEQARLLDAVDTAVIATDLAGSITHWSSGAERTYGWSAAEVAGRRISDVMIGRDGLGAPEEIGDDGGVREGELELRRRDGTTFRAFVRDTLLRDEGGDPYGVVGVAVDLTERVSMERHLRSTNDFMGLVTQTMGDGLFVLDGAGRVQLMNNAAETLLGWTADELRGRLMHPITHGVYDDGTPRPIEECPITRARTLGESIRVDSDVFVHRSGRMLPVSYSAQPFVSGTGDHGWVVVFTDISARQAREAQLRREVADLRTVALIRDALLNDRFVLLAQPIVSLRTGEPIQHEVLIRMRSAEGALLAPGDFLPVAERYGLIRDIDRWVVRAAMVHAGAGHPVGINLSADSLSDPGLLAYVQIEMAAAEVDARLVVFEITETAIIKNETAALQFLEGVSLLGCEIALDDFGTGYGGLCYVKRLPVTYLKIDREFVTELALGTADQFVIEAVVRLAQRMGKSTIAEGVEDRSTTELLQALGVDRVQGYAFGYPRPADDVFRRGASEER